MKTKIPFKIDKEQEYRRKALLLNYINNYANKGKCIISMREEDADEFIVKTFEEMDYKQIYHSKSEMTAFKKCRVK